MPRFAVETSPAPNVSVQFNYVSRTRRLMQPVDVLGYQGKISKSILPTRDGCMSRIGLQGRQQVAAIIEPLPDGRQISLQHPRGRNDVKRHSLPHGRVAAAAKRWHT